MSRIVHAVRGEALAGVGRCPGWPEHFAAAQGPGSNYTFHYNEPIIGKAGIAAKTLGSGASNAYSRRQRQHYALHDGFDR